MTTALAQREAIGPGLSADQIALIKRQLMSAKRKPTDDELALFVHQCNRTGLDPFSDQIYAIYRWDSRHQDEAMKVQVSIHGLRLVADRTRGYAPGNEYWCGEDGVWRDVWLDDQPPKAARVTVRKFVGNQLIEFSVPARWKEFAPYKNGRLQGLWERMPALMLAKCSEALALRKAFPNETSGLYIREEMDQADDERAERVVDEIKQTFDATETAPPADPPPPPAAAARTTETAAQSSRNMQAQELEKVNGEDPNAILTDEQQAKLAEYLVQVQAPEPFVNFGLMTLGKSAIAELTVGEARTLMEDAKSRFAQG